VVAGPGASPVAEDILKARGIEVLRAGTTDGGRLDLRETLKALAERGITRLMVEGGPTVAAAFVRAGLVDEAALFRSPHPIGTDGIDALEGLPLAALTDSPALKMAASENIGPDRLDLFERS
jgi:diaminohydroxyphosphoribosylaminopyrimidine deaminase/5-amino-6-(5-phosphoribosylamino)uracil reductase